MRCSPFQALRKDLRCSNGHRSEWWVVPQLLSLGARLHFFPSVEVWHRLLEASLRNWVNGCSHEGHFDSERVAGCPAASC